MDDSSPSMKHARHRVVSGPMILTPHKPPQVAQAYLSSPCTDSGSLRGLPKATRSCCARTLEAGHGSACPVSLQRKAVTLEVMCPTHVARCLAHVSQAVPRGGSKHSETSLFWPWLEL